MPEFCAKVPIFRCSQRPHFLCCFTVIPAVLCTAFTYSLIFASETNYNLCMRTFHELHIFIGKIQPRKLVFTECDFFLAKLKRNNQGLFEKQKTRGGTFKTDSHYYIFVSARQWMCSIGNTIIPYVQLCLPEFSAVSSARPLPQYSFNFQ